MVNQLLKYIFIICFIAYIGCTEKWEVKKDKGSKKYGSNPAASSTSATIPQKKIPPKVSNQKLIDDKMKQENAGAQALHVSGSMAAPSTIHVSGFSRSISNHISGSNISRHVSGG